MELISFIEERACRFAASPKEGYLAGYSPHIRDARTAVDERLARVRRWSANAAWLYSVAEQDIPARLYRWEIAESLNGQFSLLVYDTKSC